MCEPAKPGNNKHMVLRPINAAAYITGRHPDLLRRWYRQGRLTAACDTRTRAILIDLTQAAGISAATQHRRAA